MSNISSLKEPYRAVTKGEWKDLQKFFDDDVGFRISYPMTVAEDNAFHIAVHSKREEPLKQFLEQVSDHMYDSVLNKTNAYENTVLHEAAINHNIKAVKLLVEGKYDTPDKQLSVEERVYVTPQQLLERNKSGQTPLFKAAAFGSTKVVKYLASRPNQMITTADNKQQLHNNHRINGDGFSILHAAVQGEHFGTALELLKLDEGLAELKTKNGMTSLHLLTNLPSAFTNKFSDHLWHRLLYFCIPPGDYDNYDDADTIDEDKYDVKVGDNISEDNDDNQTALETINKSFWRYFIRDGRFPIVRKIWKEKRKLKFVFMLARKLIEIDDSWSWEISYTEDTTKYYKPIIDDQQSYFRSLLNDEEMPVEIVVEDTDDTEDKLEMAEDYKHQVETPLLAATRRGVIELVKEILKKHPQAVEHVSHKKQNILHVAACHRRRDIFELVKKMDMPTRRLIMGIDEEGYTVLHHVADTRNFTEGTRPGPAYQLQDELEWFQMVEEIMPSYFTQHHDKKKKTAKELFREKHEIQLWEARKWIKETSQLCSGVAFLVAALVFAAAFTVPGGTNDKNGLPNLIHSPFFQFFTVMDVVSLSCSLTSIFMFLSIVTSTFKLDDFRVLIPRRMTLNFALLFMSVATTMLAFISTIFLITGSEQRQLWTPTLICSAAIFIPVIVLVLTGFPLFFVLFFLFTSAWNYLIALPCCLLLRMLKFLGILVHQRILCFLNFLCNLCRQDDHLRLENERNV